VSPSPAAIPAARPRVQAYDRLRVVAIAAVVAIHTLMVYRGRVPTTAPVALIDALLHFAVPVFFFVSGALVWSRPLPDGPGAYVRFLRGRAYRVLLPYLAWSAVYLAILAAWGHPTSGFPAGPEGWTATLTAAPILLLTGRAWYHLYFVPALLFFYLLTPLASRAIARKPEWLLAAAYAVRAEGGAAVFAAANRLGGSPLLTLAATVTTHLSDVVLGAWFAMRMQAVLPRLRRWWPASLAVGTAVLLARMLALLPKGLPAIAAGSVVPAGMALQVLGLAGLAFAIPANERRDAFAARLAALSYGVYLVHPLLVLAWNGCVTALGAAGLWEHAWFAVLSMSAIGAASFAVTSVLSRWRASAWLVGVDARRRSAA
jgi:probable poly-beta-1,6-N-acetyl-D-glucosamine export protein